MKDAYSFDVDDNQAEKSYEAMYRAYENIFSRCGLKFKAVEADSGPIGGNFSHEFMVLADTGEDTILSCSACNYAANLEKAEIDKPEALDFKKAPTGNFEKVHTPGVRTVEEVCEFLDISNNNLIKTLIYSSDKGLVAALVRGDHEVNEAKLRRVIGCETLELADEAEIEKSTSAPRGFAGPVGLKVRTIADIALLDCGPYVVGGNEEDYHLKDVWLSRDSNIDTIDDIRNALEGDSCPRCSSGSLEAIKGIEVGHVFKLGTKYSKAMNAMFLDENGELRPMIMGCYGIGVGRVVAAAVEQYADDAGIVFPESIAPYQVMVLPVNVTNGPVMETATEIYSELKRRGIDTIIDDRDVRPGVKFMDADLIGIPYRITVGAKGLKDGIVEVKQRATAKVERISPEEVAEYCISKLKDIGESIDCTDQ